MEEKSIRVDADEEAPNDGTSTSHQNREVEDQDEGTEHEDSNDNIPGATDRNLYGIETLSLDLVVVAGEGEGVKRVGRGKDQDTEDHLENDDIMERQLQCRKQPPPLSNTTTTTTSLDAGRSRIKEEGRSKFASSASSLRVPKRTSDEENGIFNTASIARIPQLKHPPSIPITSSDPAPLEAVAATERRRRNMTKGVGNGSRMDRAMTDAEHDVFNSSNNTAAVAVVVTAGSTVLPPEPSSAASASAGAASAASPYSNVNRKGVNGSDRLGIPPTTASLTLQLDQEQDNESATTVSLSDRPGAFRIYPYGRQNNRDDDGETVTVTTIHNERGVSNNMSLSTRTTSMNNSAVEASSFENVTDDSHLPMAQTLEQDDVEKEVLERIRSREPVIQAESILIAPSSPYKYWSKWIMPFVILVAISIVVLSATGVLFSRAQSSPPSTASSSSPPTTAPIAEPILEWLEAQRIITNGTKIRSEPSSAQYRAIEWFASTHLSNVTTILENNPLAMVQQYALVTFYFAIGGDTGKWFNDRLWLSPEPVCDWAGITCGRSNEDDDAYYSQNSNNNNFNDGVITTTNTFYADADVIVALNLGTSKSLAGTTIIDIDCMILGGIMLVQLHRFVSVITCLILVSFSLLNQ
jgi:hypothetical protein